MIFNTLFLDLTEPTVRSPSSALKIAFAKTRKILIGSISTLLILSYWTLPQSAIAASNSSASNKNAASSSSSTSYNYIYYITGENDNSSEDLLVDKPLTKVARKNQNDIVKDQKKNRLVQVPGGQTPNRVLNLDQDFAQTTNQAMTNRPSLVLPANVRPVK